MNSDPGTGTPLLAAILLWALATLGCAKVGDPLPPLVHAPPAVGNLQLVQVGEEIQLRFQPPTDTADQVEAYRQCGGIESAAEPSEPLSYARLEEIPSDGGTLALTDSPPLNRRCRYAIRLVDRQGRRSSFSNFVAIDLAPAPPPPTGLRHRLRADRVIVSWEPPPGSSGPAFSWPEGYLVNSLHFVAGPEFEDPDPVFGVPRSYQVQTVGRRGNPLILSRPGDRLTIVPEDEFPPRTPANVRVIQLEGQIRLLWDANPEDDLDGYIVYRGSEPDRLLRIPSLIRTGSFADAEVVTGRVYYYQVAAVDRSGNESPGSEPLSIRVIPAKTGASPQ